MKKLMTLVLLFSSGLIWAQAEAEKKPAPEPKMDPVKFQQAVEAEVDRRLKRIKAKNIEQFARDLLEKEKQLEVKTGKIANREKQLVFNEKTLEKKIKELEQRQLRVLGCMDKNEGEAKKRVDHLVKIISGMRPQKAAEILSVQDSEISVKILSTIESIKASKIFNLMDKEISARLQKEYMDMKRLP